MRWLIVEDALRDRTGHWYEYVATFRRGLTDLRDDVTILADRNAERFITEGVHALPLLPSSIWHRMSDNASAIRRVARIPAHAVTTVRAIRRFASTQVPYDIVFVPTVLVHHIAAWKWLAQRKLTTIGRTLLLYFVSAPIKTDDSDGQPAWMTSPSTLLLRWLLGTLRTRAKAGDVILGVETEAMRSALATLTGLPIHYLPQPVEPAVERRYRRPGPLVAASYGGSRHEKGSDVLYRAVAKFLQRYPKSGVRFVLQHTGGFDREREAIAGAPQVTWRTGYYVDEHGYAEALRRTDLMLLPYRLSSYRLRGSRVAVEGMVNEIPFVATAGTTFAEQAKRFGAALECGDGDADSLAAAIAQAEREYDSLARRATEAASRAREHFSVEHFRERLLAAIASPEAPYPAQPSAVR